MNLGSETNEASLEELRTRTKYFEEKQNKGIRENFCKDAYKTVL